MLWKTSKCSAKMTVKQCQADSRLQFLHGSNISGLDMVLILLDLLLEIVQRDLVIFNDHVDLELLDTETDRYPFAATPDKTVHLDRKHALLKLF